MKLINSIILMALITLMAGCSMLNEPPQLQNTAGGGASGDLAQVRVNIGTNARTILPDFDWIFSKYALSVAPSGDNTQSEPPPVEIIDTDWGIITIPHGEWIITATAYILIDGIDYPAAKGSVPLYVGGNTWVEISVNMPEPGGRGTFAYTVAYPADGSAQVKLEPWPIGTGAALLDNVPVSSGVAESKDVPSGIYFLTVKATANGKTVIRNEVVHIYQQLSTNANYVFTKLDFGADSLRIGGTVKVLLNGQQPESAILNYSFNDRSRYSSYITFSGDDGTGTWGFEFSNLGGADTLYLRVTINGFIETEEIAIPVPIDDKTNIDLGTVTVDIDFVSLSPNTWFTGTVPPPSTVYVGWYTISVTEGTTYYFWMNNYDEGDGSKTASAGVTAYSSREVLLDTWNAWYLPRSFTAYTDGTVYLNVRAQNAYSDTAGTYAIAYSTSRSRPGADGADGLYTPEGYAWAWFPYTTADITYPDHLPMIMIHIGDEFIGDGHGGTVIIHEIILANDKIGTDVITLYNFAAGYYDEGNVYDYGLMDKVVDGNYEHSSASDGSYSYLYGGAFSCPAMMDYSYVGFCIKMDGVNIGDARVELGGGGSSPVQNIKLFSDMID